MAAIGGIMDLSAPIYVLKSKAKKLAKVKSIKMIEALNEIAKVEGYSSWSLLMSKREQLYPNAFDQVLDFFNPGDLVLIGARPSIGKTSFTIGLFVQAIEQNQNNNYFFSLSEVHRDIEARMKKYNATIGEKRSRYFCDYSEMICAEYIIKKLEENVSKGSLIVIDYLQLLDQKRSNPEIQEQLKLLKDFARRTETIVVLISQVDRAIESRDEKKPTVQDIRIVNHFDHEVFNKIIFLYHDGNDRSKGEVIFRRPNDFSFKINWDNHKAIYF